MNMRFYREQFPRLGANVYVDPAAVVIGDVELGDDTSIWPFAVARGDVHYIRIGARTNVQDGAVLHVTHDGDYTPGGFPCAPERTPSPRRHASAASTHAGGRAGGRSRSARSCRR